MQNWFMCSYFLFQLGDLEIKTSADALFATAQRKIVKPYIFTYMLSFASISQPTILCINFNCNLFVTTFPPSSPKVSPWLFDLMTLTPGKCIRLTPDPERYRRRMTTVGRCGWLRLHSNDSLQILSHNTTCDPSKYWKNVVIFPLKTNFEHSTLWSGIHKK